MSRFDRESQDYQRVEAAIAFLSDTQHRQPALAEVAASVGLSPEHFQRVFSRWAGISPKRFLQYLTKEHARQLLANGTDALSTTYAVGLSSPGRLYDLMVTAEAVTPGEAVARGLGLTVHYGIHETPFGAIILGVTDRGITALHFLQEKTPEASLAELRQRWPLADWVAADQRTGAVVDQVFHGLNTDAPVPLHLHVRGSNFQLNVWEALLKIPLGAAVTYQDVARHLGMPTAARAVGNAVGQNPIPVLIPCHRVLRKYGGFGYYGGGPLRKKALLGWESATVEVF